ncbi:hypothetical protein PGT21_032871 [Puccinia graminis f. sp. tritici]|uniref:Uncharacterized protein n=1 Tax=Puccinia graminis f. sp. tritici TaxID=56615 RepID=A0A5B0PMW9_PUCGR|nr:hypothetical protein PGT21_032871 [Puccinia graminis f. sp. tritici]
MPEVSITPQYHITPPQPHIDPSDNPARDQPSTFATVRPSPATCIPSTRPPLDRFPGRRSADDPFVLQLPTYRSNRLCRSLLASLFLHPEIMLISSDTESTLSEGEIVDEMSEDDATADSSSADGRPLSDQADPYSYHVVFLASSEESDFDTDDSASDASMDETPSAPPPSHVATDDELRALEREIFDYDPSVDGSGYTTNTDADADSEMSDIPKCEKFICK